MDMGTVRPPSNRVYSRGSESARDGHRRRRLVELPSNEEHPQSANEADGPEDRLVSVDRRGGLASPWIKHSCPPWRSEEGGEADVTR